MPKIVITEQDLTSPGVVDESFDVVYIPGYVASDNTELWDFGEDDTAKDYVYTGLKPNVPTLFKSVKEFEAKCGKYALSFGITTYSNITVPSDSNVKEVETTTARTASTEEVPGGLNTTVDTSYLLAKELLAAGIPVVYENIGLKCVAADNNPEATDKVVFVTSYNPDAKIGFYGVLFDDFYTDVLNAYSAENPIGIVDKGNFNVKYLTSGGRPVLTSVASWDNDLDSVRTAMLAVAAARGDCVALIDYDASFDEDINPTSEGSLYQEVSNSAAITNGEYGAMFTPWATYTRLTSDVEEDGTRGSAPIFMPASFAYLTSLAHSIKTNANWLAVAGVARGSVRNVSELNANIPNAVADTMQTRTGTSINAITNIKPYGNTIWGNRTLKYNAENLTATSFLNIRNLVSDVRKVAYRAARRNTFEQDTDVMWLNFKTEISTLLDRMKSGYGISGYKIVRNYEHERAAEKATVCARIILYPTYAVEDFYIDIILKDDEITVE